MTALERSIDDLRRRASLAVWLGQATRLVCGALVAGGCVALLWRILGPADSARAALVPGLLALAAPILAWHLARPRFPSREQIAPWLDLRSRAHGLVLVGAELGGRAGEWSARADAAASQAPALPVLVARPMWIRVGAGLAFALAALFVPIPQPSAGGLSAQVFEPALEELREKLETLEEEVALAEEDALELEEGLEQLEAEARDGANPEATFEAIDRFDERLAAGALEAHQRALDAQDALGEAQDSFESDANAAEEALQRAMEEMAELGLGDVLPEELSLGTPIDPANLGLPEGVELSAEMLSRMSEEMRAALAESMQRLAEAGLLSEAQLGQLGEGQLGTGEAGDLGSITFREHVCDEGCVPGPGGT